MNTQEYISSGIIESYVLGLASDEERREFEQMCRQYPEVLEARIAFEIAMEKQAIQNAIAPAADVRNRIMDEIGSGGKVVAMSSSPARSSGWLKYAAAACLILLAGSVYWNISLSKKNKDLENHYKDSMARIDEMEKDIRFLTEKETVKMASMKGLDISPSSYATVYWDTASHDVYLLANNLPAPPSNKQYQLWAILDGKPIDLGMLDYDLKQKRLLVRMKNAQGAQAFAVTLEKKDRPDPSKPEGDMYVMGGL